MSRGRIEQLATPLAVLLALAFFLQAFLGARDKSLTWDEPTYIAGGWAMLELGEVDPFFNAAPLMQQLFGLPLLGLGLIGQGLKAPDPADAAWRAMGNPEGVFGRRLLFQSGNDPVRIARLARIPVHVLGAVLVLAIFAWARRLYGAGPALGAAALAATSPNLVAHAKFATTDLGCALFMFVATFAFWRAWHSGRLRDWLLCGVLSGLALLAKFTSLLLGPIFVLLAALLWRVRPAHMTFRSLLVAGALVAGPCLLLVGFGFGQGFDPMLYVRGVRGTYRLSVDAYSWYLLGEVRPDARWYYNLVSLALKVPPSTLLLIGAAFVSLGRQRTRSEAAVFALVPAAAVFGAALLDETNLGVRRVLPAFPFLFLFCAEALRGFDARGSRILLAGLVAFSAFEGLRIHPHQLSYISVIAGGPERGPYLLDDSNFDWGQDLPALARWQAGRPAGERVKLLYFGTALPEAYGIRSDPFEELDRAAPSRGVYAISAHQLVWLRKLATTGRAVDWLSSYEPVDRAGWSIYIYEFE